MEASFAEPGLLSSTPRFCVDQNFHERDWIMVTSGWTLDEIRFLAKSFMLLAEFSSIKEKSA